MTTERLMDSLAPERTAAQSGAPLLEVRDLRVTFSQRGRVIRAVDGVNYSVRPGSADHRRVWLRQDSQLAGDTRPPAGDCNGHWIGHVRRQATDRPL